MLLKIEKEVYGNKGRKNRRNINNFLNDKC
jgi:hypothetical protein